MRGRAAVVAGVLAAGAALWLLRGGAEGPRGADSAGESSAGRAPETAGVAGSAGAARGLAAAPAKASAGAAPATAEPSSPAAAVDFRGIVVDEKGAPLPGVPITPESSERRKVPAAVRSAADGRFAFAVPVVEYLSVRAEAPGRALRGMTASLEREKENRLVLVPACPLRVRVRDDATGVPVEGAAVRIVTGMMIDAVLGNDVESSFAQERTTDGEGRATLEGEGGLCNVQVIPKAHAPRLVAHVNVPAEGRDLEVRVGRGGVVEGRVVGPAGAPVAAARVRIDVPPLYRRDATTGADGRFRFEAVGTEERERMWTVPGQSGGTLSASAAGFARASVDFDPPKVAETRAIEVSLVRGRRVTGVVRTAEGGPAAGARVGLDWDSGTEDAASPTRTVADAEGRFELRDLSPGVVALWADDAQNRVHVQVSVEVPTDADPPPLTIDLPSRAGRATVRVIDAAGRPVPGAQVTVKAGPPVIDIVGKGVTGADGSIVLSGLPTDAAAVQVLPPGSVMHVRELGPADLAGGDVVFTLEAGEVSGRALRADGTPARVRLALDHVVGCCQVQGDPVATDPDGGFRFRRLPKGSFELRVVDEGEVLVMVLPWVRTGETDARVWVARADEAAKFHVEALLVDASTDHPVPIEAFSAEFTQAGGKPGSRFSMSSTATGGTTEVGRFVSFSPLPPGVYDATFLARGWRRASLAGLRVPRDGPIPVLRVDRGARVEGRVLSPDGRPIPDVSLGIGNEGTAQGGKTDADGTFTVTGLEPGEQPAHAWGRFVQEDRRTVRVPAVGDDRIEWRLRPAGAIDVDFAEHSMNPVGESVVATPIAGGKALREEDDTEPLRDSHRQNGYGTHFDGLAPGRWRIEARQGTTTFPAQEVDVKAGEVTSVRFPAK